MTDYKEILRDRIKEARRSPGALSLRDIANKIPLQYTYLSKALHDEKVHLREDHLFSLCQILQLLTEEIDYLFLLRSFAITTDAHHERYLENRIRQFQRNRELSAEPQTFRMANLNEEMAYLFDPLCVLVHVSLFIKEFADHPRRLCAPLGITSEQLNQTLSKLHRLNFIEMKSNQTEIRALKNRIHYGTEHPLMRVHQSLLRTLSATQLLKVADSKRHSLITTFAGDGQGFEKIRQKFQEFLREVEKIASDATNCHTYQLNFDLFEWL